ncbi:MAG: ATPase, T2SS/T4P/T4SS family [Steroidobacteraceae bacterium]
MPQSDSPLLATQDAGRDLPEPLTTVAELRAQLLTPHPPHRQKIGQLLLEAGAIRDTGLQRILTPQSEPSDMKVGRRLLQAREIDEESLYRALSAQIGVPYVKLGDFVADPGALAALPAHLAREHHVLPLMFHGERLVIATDDPADTNKASLIRFRCQMPLEAVLANPHDLETAIALHYPAMGDVTLEAEAAQHLGQSTTESPAGTAIEQLAQEKPIVRLVHTLLADAVLRRASDIHIRPLEKNGEAHYRIDGALLRVGELHRNLLPGVVARIKVLAQMDLAEHRMPQDGAIRFRAPSGQVDMRVSIMPTVHGENVVIRILDPRMGLRRLEDVGFSATDGKRFGQLINRNQGLVLVTGPTGCGKTTTLYAALHTLNTGEFHIITVENPVEYRIDGLVQVQVNPALHLDFASVLRNILRHDPDIILIGEVRDAETAKIAIESALTGHLVLSTLHTNGAAQTVNRLVEIGVPSYLVNATLAGVLAQRLVRRNCEHCRVAEEVSAEIRESLAVGKDEKFWRGHGCPECSGTGTRGRVAVYELLEMSAALCKLVVAGAGYRDIEAQAVAEGMVRLTDQALGLARTGQISLAEVFRVRLD